MLSRDNDAGTTAMPYLLISQDACPACPGSNDYCAICHGSGIRRREVSLAEALLELGLTTVLASLEDDAAHHRSARRCRTRIHEQFLSLPAPTPTPNPTPTPTPTPTPQPPLHAESHAGGRVWIGLPRHLALEPVTPTDPTAAAEARDLGIPMIFNPAWAEFYARPDIEALAESDSPEAIRTLDGLKAEYSRRHGPELILAPAPTPTPTPTPTPP